MTPFTSRPPHTNSLSLFLSLHFAILWISKGRIFKIASSVSKSKHIPHSITHSLTHSTSLIYTASPDAFLSNFSCSLYLFSEIETLSLSIQQRWTSTTFTKLLVAENTRYYCLWAFWSSEIGLFFWGLTWSLLFDVQTVYKGRKKKSIEYYAIKSVEKSQKNKLLHEVRLFDFNFSAVQLTACFLSRLMMYCFVHWLPSWLVNCGIGIIIFPADILIWSL